MVKLIETRLATIELVSEDLLEIRYKPDHRLDVEGLKEVMDERQRLCAAGPYRVLAIFHPDNDFDLGVMLEDHYRGRGLKSCTKALAIAARSSMAENMINLYFAYFPQGLNMAVFPEETEARHWLATAIHAPALN